MGYLAFPSPELAWLLANRTRANASTDKLASLESGSGASSLHADRCLLLRDVSVPASHSFSFVTVKTQTCATRFTLTQSGPAHSASSRWKTTQFHTWTTVRAKKRDRRRCTLRLIPVAVQRQPRRTSRLHRGSRLDSHLRREGCSSASPTWTREALPCGHTRAHEGKSVQMCSQSFHLCKRLSCKS